MSKLCDDCDIKKENKRLKKEVDELWERIEATASMVARVTMSPFAEAGITFDGKKEEVVPEGIPGHQRREQRRKKEREEKDRRKK